MSLRGDNIAFPRDPKTWLPRFYAFFYRRFSQKMDFQERMADICSLSLFFSTLSYQLLLYCWTINQWTNPSFRDESAVGVIAFMCLLAAFLLLVQLTIGDLQKSKIAAVLSSVLHFVAGKFRLLLRVENDGIEITFNVFKSKLARITSLLVVQKCCQTMQ